MLRLLFVLLLSLCVWAEESPVVVKGQFHGKVRDQVFDQNFDIRLEPGEKNEFRVEMMENINLSLAVVPKWHYSSGTTPDGILVSFFVKCFADEPKMRLQRTAMVLLEPGGKSLVELHEKDSDNVFSVDFQADRENPNAPVQPKEEPKETPKPEEPKPEEPKAPEPDK
ncbi:MAG: hypothetical protein J0I12_22920 [Candidatus Eremiobacteraeota bacterium]|nr:hypothetical protein [Candidatus Eremiobacteraeota bacterium]